jgi:hypothetical protein
MLVFNDVVSISSYAESGSYVIWQVAMQITFELYEGRKMTVDKLYVFPEFCEKVHEQEETFLVQAFYISAFDINTFVTRRDFICQCVCICIFIDTHSIEQSPS